MPMDDRPRLPAPPIPSADLGPPGADAGLSATDAAALRRLRQALAPLGRALVAFSGGVDSALVLAVAVEQLGPGALALTALSETFPPEELAVARREAARLGAEHLLIDSHELDREGYVANAGDRCYHCKTELFSLARAEADARGIAEILDGTVLDDLGEHRPGLRAAGERAVRHPLVDAQIDKATVRRLARALGVEVWDKPSFACLGSRFPVGTRVTPERLRAVQRVESHLRLIGLRQLRARWHAVDGRPLLRLELDPADLALVVQEGLRQSIVDVARAEGFAWVTLDLQGYARGGLSLAP
jgi:uncharacterized protein